MNNLKKPELNTGPEPLKLIDTDQFNGFFDASPDCIFVKDLNFKYKAANKAMAERFGLTPEEIIGCDDVKLFNSSACKELRAIDKRVIGGETITKESSLPIKGKTHIFSTKKYPLKNSNGNIIGLSGIARDITELIDSQKNLKASEKIYHAIFDNSPEAILLLDRKGNFMNGNESFLKLGGFTIDEVLGKSLLKLPFLTKKSKKDAMKNFLLRIAGIKVPPYEIEYVNKAGELRYGRIIAAPLIEEGKAIGDLAIVSDITEQKRHQQLLEENEEKFKVIFNSSPDSFYLHDLKGNFVDCNETAIKLFGYSREEAIGKNFADIGILPAGELAKALSNLAFLASGKTLPPVEYKVKKKNGTIVTVEIALRLVTIAGKKLILGIVRDLSERAKTKKIIEHLASFPDLNPNPVIEYDLKGMLLYANKSAIETIKKLGSKIDISSFLPPDYKELINNNKKGSNVKIVSREIKIAGKIFLEDVDVNEKSGIIRIYARDITENKNAEIAIMGSEEKYRTIFNNTGTSTIIIEANTIISLANDEFAHLVGYSRDEIENKKSWAEFTSPGDKVRLTEYHYARRKKNGQAPSTYELKILDRDKNIKNVIMKVAMIPNTDKSLAALLDITELKKKEKQLTESQDQIKQILQNTSVPTFVMSKDHRITHWNKACELLIGVKAEEVLGKKDNWWAFYKEKRPLLADIMLDEDEEKKLEIYFKNELKPTSIYPDGREGEKYVADLRTGPKWLYFTGVPLKNNKGETLGVIETFQDMTYRREIEEKLRTSEEKFKDIVENVREVIMLSGTDGTINYASPAAKTVYGYEPSELIGKKPWIIHTEDSDLVREKHIASIKGEAFNDLEYRIKTKTGEKKYVSHSSRPIINQGKIQYILSTVVDVTERKLAQKALEQKVNLDNLVSSIATRFISLNTQEIQKEINIALGEIGRLTESDRSYIFIFSQDKKEMSNVYEWCASGIIPQRDKLQNFKLDGLPWFKKTIMAQEIFSVPDVAALPAEAKKEKLAFEEQLIKSLICMPVVFNKEMFGFLGFDSVRQHKVWDKDVITMMRITGELFANAIMRKRYDEERERKSSELENFNKLAVDRELKMVEIKKELKKLKELKR